MVDDELPARMRLRDFLGRNWAVVLATVLLTLVMIGAVSTLF